jgi:hypothetical protein
MTKIAYKLLKSKRKSKRNSKRKSKKSKTKNIKNVESIINMLKDYKYGRIHGDLLNLLLVKYGARKAFLLESSNFVGEEEYVKEILNIASDIGLCKTRDIISLEDHPRYWITKEKLNNIPETDEDIGDLLGMKNPGGEFYDYTKKRLSLSIFEEKTGGVATTELLLGDMKDEDNQLFAKKKTRSFNKVMKNLNLPYKFVYNFDQNDGAIKRLEELERRNIDYIREHIREYTNDIDNCIIRRDNNPIIDLFKRSIFIYENNQLLFNKYLPLFIYIYKLLIDEVGETSDFDTKMEDINSKFIDLIELNLN